MYTVYVWRVVDSEKCVLSVLISNFLALERNVELDVFVSNGMRRASVDIFIRDRNEKFCAFAGESARDENISTVDISTYARRFVFEKCYQFFVFLFEVGRGLLVMAFQRCKGCAVDYENIPNERSFEIFTVEVIEFMSKNSKRNLIFSFWPCGLWFRAI